jgi:hypothetical protein
MGMMDEHRLKQLHGYGKALRSGQGEKTDELVFTTIMNAAVAVDELVAEVKQLQQVNVFWRAGHYWAYDMIASCWETLGMEPGPDLAAEIRRRIPTENGVFVHGPQCRQTGFT